MLCDIADAFPSIHHQWLQRCFDGTQMPSWLHNFLLYYLSCHTARVRHGLVQSKSFAIKRGILQGCVLVCVAFRACTSGRVNNDDR